MATVLVIPHHVSSHLAVREVELARGLAARHTVFVAARREVTGTLSLLDKVRFHLESCRLSQRGNGSLRWVYFPRLHKAPQITDRLFPLFLRRFLAAERIDVVLNAACFGEGVPRGRARYLYDLVDDHVAGYARYGLPGQAMAAEGYIAREVARADCVITVSQGLSDLCKSRYGRDAVTIPNGFWPWRRMATGEDDLRELRRRLGLEGRRVIGYIGSLDGWVRLDFVFQVFESVRKNHPEVSLLIVGGGPTYERLRRQLSADAGITMTGWVDREAVTTYFHLLEVGLIPFEVNALTDHACPIKALEYTYCGIPVVSSPLRELSRLGLANVLLLPMEVEAWARKIGDLLGGYQFDQPMERLSRFHWDTLAREVEKCWERSK